MNDNKEGRVVKVMDYDAFGNILSDSNPNLFLPLAFAGGLRDRFTGLVRFLHRDYAPTVGRFTAPDPLGDTGGDHDLYDYCVDEPVGRVDPEGLKSKDADEGEGDGKGEAEPLSMVAITGPGDGPADMATHSTQANPESAWWVESGSQSPGGEQAGKAQSTGEGALEKMAPGWHGVGLAVDSGEGIGFGAGQSDPKAIADGSGRGMYAEYSSGSENSTGKLDSGMFKYDTHGRIAGGKAGYGYNLTVYDPPATKTLAGTTGYETWYLGPFSTTRMHNPETGRIVGWSLGVGGKAYGLGRELGESTGQIANKAK